MVTNVSEKDKALQEVIDWCTDRAKELFDDMEGDYYDTLARADELARVILHCQSMLGSGSMPSEVPNQSEDAK